MTTDTKPDLEHLTLAHGAHVCREDGVDIMEAVAWWAGLPHSDRPACTDPMVAAYARVLNDNMPDDVRQRLIPYIPRLARTANGRSQKEVAFLSDYVARVFAPKASREAESAAVSARSAESAVWDEALELLDKLLD